MYRGKFIFHDFVLIYDYIYKRYITDYDRHKWQVIDIKEWQGTLPLFQLNACCKTQLLFSQVNNGVTYFAPFSSMRVTYRIF